MSFRDHKQVKAEKFSPRVRYMLRVFRAVFGCSLSNMVIRHYRDDAVFIQVDRLYPYQIARFVEQVKDVHIELGAIAPNYFEIQLFGADHFIPEIARHIEMSKIPYEHIAKDIESHEAHTYYYVNSKEFTFHVNQEETK